MFSGGAYAAWMARASDDNVCGRTGPWGTGGERWRVRFMVERTKERVGTY